MVKFITISYQVSNFAEIMLGGSSARVGYVDGWISLSQPNKSILNMIPSLQ